MRLWTAQETGFYDDCSIIFYLSIGVHILLQQRYKLFFRIPIFWLYL